MSAKSHVTNLFASTSRRVSTSAILEKNRTNANETITERIFTAAALGRAQSDKPGRGYIAQGFKVSRTRSDSTKPIIEIDHNRARTHPSRRTINSVKPYSTQAHASTSALPLSIPIPSRTSLSTEPIIDEPYITSLGMDVQVDVDGLALDEGLTGNMTFAEIWSSDKGKQSEGLDVKYGDLIPGSWMESRRSVCSAL